MVFGIDSLNTYWISLGKTKKRLAAAKALAFRRAILAGLALPEMLDPVTVRKKIVVEQQAMTAAGTA